MALSSTVFPGMGIFNATFQQPTAPLVATELSGPFLQHKWSDTLSHITSGHWYNSATHSSVRIDETYSPGVFGTSFFSYNDTSPNGVKNHQILIGPNASSAPACFSDYVSAPAFPLVTADLLRANDAVYGGIVADALVGECESWHFLFGAAIPVTVYLDAQSPPVLLGYDFWGPVNRTKVVTRFFAHRSGPIEDAVFEGFECPAEAEAEGEGEGKAKGAVGRGTRVRLEV